MIVRDRTDIFHEYAQARGRGKIVATPTMFNKEQRRLYVRQTMREDHQFRIKNRPEGAQAKFEKLASSPFVFFRGAALIYYRDYAGSDAHLPRFLRLVTFIRRTSASCRMRTGRLSLASTILTKRTWPLFLTI